MIALSKIDICLTLYVVDPPYHAEKELLETKLIVHTHVFEICKMCAYYIYIFQQITKLLKSLI